MIDLLYVGWLGIKRIHLIRPELFPLPQAVEILCGVFDYLPHLL